MGLDVVELIMKTEDEFGIKIHDEDWQCLRTVSDLSAYVEAALTKDASRECPSPRIFTTLRRSLMSSLGLVRHRVRPSTPLSQIPRERRRQTWQQVTAETGYELPPLDFTRAHYWCAAMGALTALLMIPFIIGVAVLMPLLLGMVFATAAIVVLWVMAVVPSVMFQRVSSPWATEFPRGYETIGDLVRGVARREGFQQYQAVPRNDSDEIYRRVRDIVSEQLNFPREDIQPTSRFFEDLRAD